MAKFKVTSKRKAVVDRLEEDIKDISGMDDSNFNAYWVLPLGLSGVTEDSDGVESDQAFFDFLEKGIKPSKVTNLRRLARLMMAHRRTNWKV